LEIVLPFICTSSSIIKITERLPKVTFPGSNYYWIAFTPIPHSWQAHSLNTAASSSVGCGSDCLLTRCINRLTDTKNSREILHFLVNCCVGATSTAQYHPTYYKNVERCCLFNLRLLVQPESQYWMLAEPMNSHDRCPVPGELLV
jgi:hypothetical protein